MLLLHDALDILHDDDRIIDEQADGEHHAEERQAVDRVAEGSQHRGGAEQHHGNRDRRNECRTYVLQEQQHHEEHEPDRLGQCHHHVVHRLLDEGAASIG